MRNTKLLLALAISTVMLSGCQNMDANMLANSGISAFKAATLSDADVKALANDACKEMDTANKVAGASSKYTKRLNNIAKALGNKVDGTPVNYKVYLTSDVNAWAMANGCVRVYSGLMDLMTDNEVEAVLGHELGHVALGHSRKAMQAEYATLAAQEAISATSGVAAQLSKSQLGALANSVVNSAFSRSQESDSDDYSYDLLKKRGINTSGLVTSFEKLAKLGGSSEKSMFASHPPSTERARHIRDRIAADKK